MSTKNKILLSALLLCAACAPSPLYVGSASRQIGTGGEVPRDGRGEPIWSAIKPPPVDAAPPNAAPNPVIVAPGGTALPAQGGSGGPG